jgi:hypothetical protein
MAPSAAIMTPADVEDLDDRRRLVGTEGGDACVQRLRIGALEDGHDLVIRLALVELLGKRLDDLVVGAGHGVPPLDLGDGKRSVRGAGGKRQAEDGRDGELHGKPPFGFEQTPPASRGA